MLAQIYDRLDGNPQPQEIVASRARLARDEFAIALEKLWIHGGAIIDDNEDLLRGAGSWRSSYEAQRAHKVAQFQKMLTYCEAPGCRMSQLVHYFGDRADSGKACGTCDFCAPGSTVASTQRPLTKREQHDVERMLDWLRKNDGLSTGKLHQLAFPDNSLDRRGAEELIAAMARSGVVTTAEASFEKNGEVIEYRKVFLTLAGQDEDAAETVLIIDDPAPEKPRVRKKKKSDSKKAKAKPEAAEEPSPKRKKKAPRESAVPQQTVNTDTIAAALKAWRLNEARKRGVPAFRILTDRAVEAIAAKQPQTTSELLQAPGVGLKVAEQYGAQIFRILSKTRG